MGLIWSKRIRVVCVHFTPLRKAVFAQGLAVRVEPYRGLLAAAHFAPCLAAAFAILTHERRLTRLVIAAAGAMNAVQVHPGSSFHGEGGDNARNFLGFGAC